MCRGVRLRHGRGASAVAVVNRGIQVCGGGVDEGEDGLCG